MGFHHDACPEFGQEVEKFLCSLRESVILLANHSPFDLQCSLLAALWGILLAPWLENTGVAQVYGRPENKYLEEACLLPSMRTFPCILLSLCSRW